MAADADKSKMEDDYLSLKSLSMPRQQISMSLQAPAIRIYCPRGWICMREMSVTGFTGGAGLGDGMPRFNLSFREESTGTLIQDVQDECVSPLPDPLYFNQGTTLSNKLGPKWNGPDGNSEMLISQEAVWEPNGYTRTGNYHRILKDQLISFGIINRTSLSFDADEVYEEFEIENRLDRPLVLTVIPDQSSNPRTACFVTTNKDYQITVVSDLGLAVPEGWRMEIPSKGKATGRIALEKQKLDTPVPKGYYAADLSARIEKSKQATRKMLRWAGERLPHVETQNKQFDEFYKRSILTLLCCRMNRTDFVIQPFYMFGNGMCCYPWDSSFASETIALLDPEGLRKTLVMLLTGGQAFNSFNVQADKPNPTTDWNGVMSSYAQNPFALIRMINDYLRITGDTALLDEKISGHTALEYLKMAGRSLNKQYARPDGLLDFGEGTGKFLEIRTSGYEHVIAALNGIAADYFRQVAQWCKDCQDPEYDEFKQLADRLQEKVNTTLWNDEAGWHDNLYPGDRRQLVMSYHQFDLLDTTGIPLQHKQRMATHIKTGEFLAPYGIFSISPGDRAHWDREDCDWGGGGQYVGCPLRITESLYRLGESEKAWELLSRCTQWVQRFPYFPQTTYGDDLILQPHQRDWPLQISGGGGAQAVIFGLFGIHPALDGSLEIAPNYNKTLGEAKLTGFRFKKHTYDIFMSEAKTEIFCDGKLVGGKSYKSTAEKRTSVVHP
jgi:hypothetical protein